MGKEQTRELLKLFEPFDKNIKDLVLWLRDFVWDLCPESNELIYDNFNALAIGWSLTDKQTHILCTTAIYRSNQNIHFGFFFGNEINDPDKIFLGNGNQYRYILVKDKATFPKAYIKKRILESYTNALAKLKEKDMVIQGQTIFKSKPGGKKKEVKGKQQKKI